MILGRPYDLKNYIRVTSEVAKELHSCGFEPLYREIEFDGIYFLKTEDLVNKINNCYKKGGLQS